MARTAADYQDHLTALLPPGQAFPREVGSNLTDLLAGMAEEWARVDLRAEQLIIETNPQTTYELLGRWEGVLGLPDECTLPGATLDERRTAVVAKFLSLGGLSRGYYLALAASLGYPGATITEFRSMTCESTCDAGIDPDPWSSVWMLNLPASDRLREMGADALCDEALATWGNTQLECVVAKQAPAHSILHFTYGAL